MSGSQRSQNHLELAPPDEIGRDEVKDLVGDSYCLRAPRGLAALARTAA